MRLSGFLCLVYYLLASATAEASITSATATNSASRVVYAMQYSGTWQRKEVLIDTDRNLNTGFRDLGGRVGADYLLQGDLLYYYTGSGSDFTWTQLAAPLIVDNGSQLRWRVDRALIGETAFPNSSLLLFRVESGTAPNLVSHEQLVEHTFTPTGRIAAPAVSSDGELVKLSDRYQASPASLLDENFNGKNSESLPLEVRPATATIASDGDYVDEFVYDTAVGGLGQIATQTRKTTTGQELHQESVQYDSLGRPQSSTTSFDNLTWTSTVIHDTLGRVDTVQDSTTESVTNSYTARGFLHQVRENNAGNLPLVTMLEQDERGQVIRERKAAGILVERSFDAASGLIDRIRSGTASAFPLTDANALVQNLDYDFDKGDNLLAREDRRSPAQGGGQREEFRYDDTNRLIRAELTRINGNTPATPVLTIGLTYDRLGSICSKADLNHPVPQAYVYAGRSGCAGALNIASRSPHQVTQAFGLSMDHDAAGNRIRETHATNPSRNRRMVYDALGQMSQTIQGSLRSSFAYGAGGKRYQRIDLQPGSSTVTRYVGAVEYIERSGQPSEIKRYIGNDLVLTKRGAAPVERRYLFSDHLGSVDTITDENGNVVERLSFDAHGNRRAPNWQALTPAMLSATTTRGFTRHEHIDSQNLIHMNGRVYDPLTGRFLQPDPVVQNTLNAQNWNRYSYVLNNPLSFTDPTGYFSKKLKKFFKRVLRAAIGVAITVVTQGWGASAFWSGVIGGSISSAIGGGDLKAVIVGGITGGLFAQTGFDLDAGLISKSQAVFQHGIIGGASSVFSGGKFHEGFLSASFGKLANFSPLGDTGIPSVLAGGLASRLSGGEFSDGAGQAAVGFLQNNIATKLVKGLVKGKSPLDVFNDIALGAADVVGSCGTLSVGCAISAGTFAFDLVSPVEVSDIKSITGFAQRVGSGARTANGARSHLKTPERIIVDSRGNAIPLNQGEYLTSSRDGKWIQVRDANGNPTGMRIDGSHSPRTHSDPRALQPHAHVPGVTNPDGTPWLQIK